jgi:hypothetical protein
MTKKKKTDKVDLNAMFPYEIYTIRLEIPSENRVCWFKDNIDATKYINRYKLDKRKIKLHEKPNLDSKTN